MRRLIAVVALTLVSSCGFGAKQALAMQIEEAADLTLSRRSVTGTLAGRLKVLETGALSGLATQPPVPVSASFEVRPSNGEAMVAEPFPNVVFTDEHIFLKRPDAAPREARPWLELSLSDVTDKEPPFDARDHTFGATRALVATIDPRILLDLAAAPLTGSIEDLGAENGLEHFRANFDLEKAMDERRSEFYDDDRTETVETLLERLSVDDGVVPGEVWFTAGGLQRVRLGIQISTSRFEVSRLDLDIVLDRKAKSTSIAKPDASQVIAIDSLAALQRSASQEGARG